MLDNRNTLEPVSTDDDVATKTFLGVRFDALSEAEALDMLFEADPASVFGYVVTPNVDHMVRIQSNGRIAALYDQAWLCLNDSRILGALSRLAGRGLAAVPGADLTAALLGDRRMRPDTPILVVGGPAGMASALRRRYGLHAVTQHRPPMGLLQNPDAMAEAVRAVEAAEARFVFFAIGSPQQEHVAAMVRERGIARGTGLCIGAALEFLVGDLKRAPVWMRRTGLEWSYRLFSEPGRMWRRYLVDGPRIFFIFASYAMGGDRSRRTPGNA